MKKTVYFTLTAASLLFASVASAEKIHATDNFIEQFNLYDSSSNSTTPGVRVRVGGQNSVYQVGDNGLTRNIIFDETGEAAEAWARDALGLDLDARICGSGGEEGDAPTFGGC